MSSSSAGRAAERSAETNRPADKLAGMRFRGRSTHRFSLAGKIAAGYLVLVVAMAAAAVILARFEAITPITSFLLILAFAVPTGAWVIHRQVRPIQTVVQSVSDGIRSFRDQDFSVRLAYRRRDELGELVELYNEVGEVLRDERQTLRQREILLGTALDRSPAGILLVNQLDRILYSNREARNLLLGGARLEGRRFDEVRAGCPASMREILDSRADGLFTTAGEQLEDAETYHLSQRSFLLNRRRHRLIVLRRLTGELGRQEAEVWKKVIRIISHELNNALAPVSSLVSSVEHMARDPRRAHRLDEAFGTIRERLDHLGRFIDGYARFARLPRPRREPVAWRPFIEGIVAESDPVTVEALPTEDGWFDPAQMRQVVINLLKNAHEASEAGSQVTLRVDRTGEGTFLQVRDQGRGMNEETLAKALLPFYSTKQTGTGLGLPLCREILEAHGGKLSLQAIASGGTLVTCWLPPRP